MKLSLCLEDAARQLDEAEVFFGHGTDNAWDEAVWLILHALEIPFDKEADLEMVLDSEQLAAIQSLLRQRIDSRKPAAYLTGTAWFAGMPFYTAEGVIVPRSHIGPFLQDQGRPWIQQNDVHRILDLCTGSACIAVAAAHYFSGSQVDATDIDALALSLAEKNIRRYGFEQRVRLIESDLFQNVSGEYDLILTNPPYVPAAEIAHFPSEYQHEPSAAFDGGEDGLDLVHRILAEASRFLRPQGSIVMEVGESWTTLEKAYQRVAFNWIETGVEDSGLFIMSRDELKRSKM